MSRDKSRDPFEEPVVVVAPSTLKWAPFSVHTNHMSPNRKGDILPDERMEFARPAGVSTEFVDWAYYVKLLPTEDPPAHD